MTRNEKGQLLNASPVNFAMNDLDMKMGEGMSLQYVPSERAIEFLEDGGVQFTVAAPTAKTVEIADTPQFIPGGSGKKYSLTKIDNARWQTVIYDLPAGFHYLFYSIDGVEQLYPLAPIGFGYGRAVNFVDIPDPEADFYEYRDVPRGTVRLETYPSQVCGYVRQCWVYTPPTYDTNPEKKYPVVYIQHGGGENEIGWFWQGKAHWILDNLIAEGKCEEMILVANAGYVNEIGVDASIFLPGDIAKLLRFDVIPFIEKRFRAIPDKAHRAMCGLSMGSCQTQYVGYNNPDLFAYLGVFSGSTKDMPRLDKYGIEKFLKRENAETLNAQYKLLFFSKGWEEGGKEQEEEIKQLNDMGIKAEFFGCSGIHEWNVWRKALRCFVQKLFK